MWRPTYDALFNWVTALHMHVLLIFSCFLSNGTGDWQQRCCTMRPTDQTVWARKTARVTALALRMTAMRCHRHVHTQIVLPKGGERWTTNSCKTFHAVRRRRQHLLSKFPQGHTWRHKRCGAKACRGATKPASSYSTQRLPGCCVRRIGNHAADFSTSRYLPPRKSCYFWQGGKEYCHGNIVPRRWVAQTTLVRCSYVSRLTDKIVDCHWSSMCTISNFFVKSMSANVRKLQSENMNISFRKASFQENINGKFSRMLVQERCKSTFC